MTLTAWIRKNVMALHVIQMSWLYYEFLLLKFCIWYGSETQTVQKKKKSERFKVFKIESKFNKGLIMMCRLIFYHI